MFSEMKSVNELWDKLNLKKNKEMSSDMQDRHTSKPAPT